MRTRISFVVQTERPLPPARVDEWLRQINTLAVSLHDPVAVPGDNRVEQEGWEYIREISDVTIEHVS